MHGSWGVLPDIFLFRIIGDNDAYFVQTYEGCNYNGVAGCYPAFHPEFCREHDYKNHCRAAYCKDIYKVIVYCL